MRPCKLAPSLASTSTSWFIAAIAMAIATAITAPTVGATPGAEVLVRGKVIDQDGEIIPSVKITFSRADDPNFLEEVTSADNGHFKVFFRDGARRFDVLLEKHGYRVTTGLIVPVVFPTPEEAAKGFVSTYNGTFRVKFRMRSVAEEMRVISIQELFNEGSTAALERKPHRAIDRFLRVLEKDPAHPKAKLSLAKAYFDAGEPANAADLFNEILQGGAADVPTIELTYHANRDAGRLDRASQVLDVLWRRAPQAAHEELFELATIQRSQGNDALARSHVERVLEVRPNHTEAHYFYARLLVSMQESEAALRHFRRFLELSPPSPRAERVKDRIKELEREVERSR